MNFWHRHLGIYGVCLKENKLLLIQKSGGPYSGRLDLPGGSMEANETLLETLEREFIEETGIKIRANRHIGTKDFLVPWVRKNHTHSHCHHIAVLYEVTYISGDVVNSPKIDDSLGAEWIEINNLFEDNCSPLVMQAVDWIRTGKIDLKVKEYKEWTIKN